MRHVPVLIVGGGLVGLSASLFLRHHRVSHLLTDKHRGSAAHPRAMGFTETTMEHYRACGIADRIPQADPGARLRRVQVKTLFSDWVAETDWTPGVWIGAQDSTPRSTRGNYLQSFGKYGL